MSEPGIDHAGQVLLLTEQLLDIPSVTGNEKGIADYLCAQLQELHPHSLIRAENSLCVVPNKPDPDKQTLMLVGHTDTVPKLSENPGRVSSLRARSSGKNRDETSAWSIAPSRSSVRSRRLPRTESPTSSAPASTVAATAAPHATARWILQ